MTVATTSTEECSASEIRARLPMAMPTANLAAAMAALAKTEIAATRDLMVWAGSFMGGGLAAHPATLKRRSESLTVDANCSDSKAGDISDTTPRSRGTMR